MLIAAKRHVWPLPARAETTVTFRAIARIERIQKWAASGTYTGATGRLRRFGGFENELFVGMTVLQ